MIGGFGEQNFGKQFRQGNRVYDSNEVAMALMSQPVGNLGGNSYLYAVCIDDLYANREPRYYIEETPTLRSERSGLKVCQIEINK